MLRGNKFWFKIKNFILIISLKYNSLSLINRSTVYMHVMR